MTPVVVGITGASGAVLALNTVDELLSRDVPTAVVCSNSARLGLAGRAGDILQ